MLQIYNAKDNCIRITKQAQFKSFKVNKGFQMFLPKLQSCSGDYGSFWNMKVRKYADDNTSFVLLFKKPDNGK